MMTPGRIRVGAYAVVIDGGRILLARVAPGHLDAGIWTLPGGRVAFGEHPDDALHRELYEETGLRATLVEPIAVDSRNLAAEPGSNLGETHWIRIYYRVVARGRPRMVEGGGGVDLAAWHQIDRLPDVSELTTAVLARVGP